VSGCLSAKIKKALERMRAATGDEDRGSYNQGHMDDFLRGIKAPVEAYKPFNRTMADIKKKLPTHVVFLAGDVRHTRKASPLRKYVNGGVGHEIILVGINKDGTQLAFIDPMTPHGTDKYKRWAPVEDFRKFGSEFREGKNYIAGTMRRGKYTAYNMLKRNRAIIILDLQEKLLALKEQWEKQQAELIVQDGKIVDLEGQIQELERERLLLEQQLEECINSEEPDCDEVVAKLADFEDRLDKIAALAVV
jgi:hypothetical protein